MVLSVTPAHETLSISEGKDYVLIPSSPLHPLLDHCQSGSISSLLLLALSPMDDALQGSQGELLKQKSLLLNTLH